MLIDFCNEMRVHSCTSDNIFSSFAGIDMYVYEF